MSDVLAEMRELSTLLESGRAEWIEDAEQKVLRMASILLQEAGSVAVSELEPEFRRLCALVRTSEALYGGLVRAAQVERDGYGRAPRADAHGPQLAVTA